MISLDEDGRCAALLIGAALIAGCSKDDPNRLNASVGSSATSSASSATGAGGADCPIASTTTEASSSTAQSTASSSASGTGGSDEPQKTVLDERSLDYNEALRTASLKLIGTLPPLQQIEELRKAPDPKAAYAAAVDAFLADPRFARRMVEFWRNTMRMGMGSAQSANLDTAPVFAARIVVEDRPYIEMFTATSGNCPTFDGTQFVEGECNNGVPQHAGILTNPAVHAHYYGNLAFRRVRFFQEVFACRKQPAELSANPEDLGNGVQYSSPWPFKSISAPDNGGGRINFLDATSAVCANCHSTSNHRAPLFANFDENGQYQPNIAVRIPVEGVPFAVITDWLPPGEKPAYKFNYKPDAFPITDLPSLGRAMAADDEVLNCAVARVWNYAMSKGDIVNDLATIPTVVIGPLLDEFRQNGFKLKPIIRSAFVHEDFVRF